MEVFVKTMTTILFASLFSLSLFGAEMKLAKITSDMDREYTDFFIETNDKGAIDSIRILTVTPSGAIDEDTSFPIETVINDGVVLAERKGYKVLRLVTDPGFTAENGGGVQLVYLFNAINGTRRFLKIKVLKTPEGTFYLAKATSDKINHLFVRGNYNVLLGLVGIWDITPSLKP